MSASTLASLTRALCERSMKQSKSVSYMYNKLWMKIVDASVSDIHKVMRFGHLYINCIRELAEGFAHCILCKMIALSSGKGIAAAVAI